MDGDHEAAAGGRRAPLHDPGVVDALPEGLVLQGPDGRIIDGNRRASELLGLTHDQLLGRTSRDPRWRAVHRDGRPFPGDEHPAMVCLRTGEPSVGTVMGIDAPDRGRRWITVSSAPVELEPGQRGVVSSFVDVTGEIADLDGERAHLRATLDSEIDPHVLLRAVRDADGHIADFAHVDVNAAACALMGLTRDQFLARRASEVVDGALLPMMLDQCRRVVATGRPLVDDDVCVVGDDGNRTYYEVRASKVGDEVSLTWRDVTARRTIEARYRTLAEHASDVVVLVGLDLTITYVSPSIERILGWRPEEAMGRNALDLLHPQDADWIQEGLRTIDTERHNDEVLARAKDGTHRWMASASTAILDEEGQVTGFVSVLRDVDEAVHARQALARSEQRFRLVMTSAPTGMAVVSLDRRFLEVNPALCAMLGRDPAWLLAHGIADVLDPADDEGDRSTRNELLSGLIDAATRETRFIRADGSHLWVQHAIGLLREDGVPSSYVSQLIDITEMKEAREDLEALATHDALTGLANRAAMNDEIARALRGSRRSGRDVAVLLVDLDHFKYVNDSLGHAVGDDLLRVAAQRITDGVRAGDLVARPGGDEFVVVMRDLRVPAEAIRAAERIVHAFRLPLLTGDSELYTTASVGVAISGAAGGPEDLVRDADAALYEAKATGRDRVSLFTADLEAAARRRLTIGAQLRPALERGDLEVWYQPEVDLDTGGIVAVEALLRWRRPDGEVWPAGRFIHVAEDTGLILTIGDWVLREACAQGARWANGDGTGAPLLVRVNLSALQVAEAGLLQAVDEALDAADLDPSLLSVEITETALLRETGTVSDNIEGLRERGIHLAADDFGAGYASLAYLRDFPLDAVKIDRSFVDGITDDDVHQHLVAGIVTLAESLSMSVTAEGVETRAQADVLHRLGCRRAQGFHYAPAMPATELTALLGRTLPRPPG
ncbi:MAG: EAL domain-containing protein [Acidimicrobiales bacterium]